MTKEERYILKVHEKTQGEGEVSRYTIGKSFGLSTKMTDHIVRDLMKANFLEKIDEEFIAMTENGMKLVNVLISH